MDDVAKSGQAGDLSDDVTPAMAKAGGELVRDFNCEFDDWDEVAAKVYRAMVAVRFQGRGTVLRDGQ